MSQNKGKLEIALETAPLKVQDDSLKENASAAENVGLEARVTREYDGVGLSNHRQCQWCLDRCGENMPYDEAYAKGAFQRHPGCGCEIYYQAEKGWQRQTDWKSNTWEDVSPHERIAQAAQEGDMVTMPPFMDGNFDDCHPLSISKEERTIFSRIHDKVLKTGNEYGEIITSEGVIPCESNKNYKVLMRTDTIDEYGLRLYHGHTNDTLPSETDMFRFVIDDKVDAIGVVTRNRNVFVVSIGDGYVPDEKEYWEAVREARRKADRAVLRKYNLEGLSEKQIDYLIIREKNIEIIRNFGWRVEGGKL